MNLSTFGFRSLSSGPVHQTSDKPQVESSRTQFDKLQKSEPPTPKCSTTAADMKAAPQQARMPHIQTSSSYPEPQIKTKNQDHLETHLDRGSLKDLATQSLKKNNETLLKKGQRNPVQMKKLAKVLIQQAIIESKMAQGLTQEALESLTREIANSIGVNQIIDQSIQVNTLELKKEALAIDMKRDFINAIKNNFDQGLTEKEVLENATNEFRNQYRYKNNPMSHVYSGVKKVEWNSFSISIQNEMKHAIAYLTNDGQDGYLKFNSAITNEHSLVRTSDGTFELINRFDEIDKMQLQQQTQKEMPAPKSSTTKNTYKSDTMEKQVLGKGGFGKARFAKKTNTDTFVVVKKITEGSKSQESVERTFDKEVQQAAKVTDGEHLVTYQGSALVTVPEEFEYGKKASSQDVEALDFKGYIFMDYAGAGTASDLVKKSSQQASQAQQELTAATIKRAATSVVTGVAQLNAQGLYHRDIKPENIFGSIETGFKVGDFGLVTDRQSSRQLGGTVTYMPPEFSGLFIDGLKGQLTSPIPEFSHEKHDAFSLGLSLLHMSHGNTQGDAPHHLMMSNGQSCAVESHVKNKYRVSKGVENFDTTKLSGITLDEVIAQLIDANPETRITAQEALTLPYFRQE